MLNSNFENLEKLYKVTKDTPLSVMNFSMRYYRTHGYKLDITILQLRVEGNDCGTCACLAGHGPLHPDLTVQKIQAMDWSDYTFLAFGVRPGTPDYMFLFSSEWDHTDLVELEAKESKDRALKRLRAYIDTKGAIASEWYTAYYRTYTKFHSAVDPFIYPYSVVVNDKGELEAPEI